MSDGTEAAIRMVRRAAGILAGQTPYYDDLDGDGAYNNAMERVSSALKQAADEEERAALTALAPEPKP